jgi:hypothetical protein
MHIKIYYKINKYANGFDTVHQWLEDAPRLLTCPGNFDGGRIIKWLYLVFSI